MQVFSAINFVLGALLHFQGGLVSHNFEQRQKFIKFNQLNDPMLIQRVEERGDSI